MEGPERLWMHLARLFRGGNGDPLPPQPSPECPGGPFLGSRGLAGRRHCRRGNLVQPKGQGAPQTSKAARRVPRREVTLALGEARPFTGVAAPLEVPGRPLLTPDTPGDTTVGSLSPVVGRSTPSAGSALPGAEGGVGG